MIRVSQEYQAAEHPPTGKAVLALIRVDGELRRVRAMWIAKHWLEAPTDIDDDPDSWDEADEAIYYREGWYEATAVEPTLTPIDDLIAWAELPQFETQTNA